MESLIHRLMYQWQRKLFAVLTAFVIWLFVSHSIISTKIIPSVPIHVVNLPNDKTINGLLPNGFLSKRTTLTLTGTKDVIDQLEPGDLEVILDVSLLPSDGIVQIGKKNLVSLNPHFNLPKHVTSVSHPEFVIKMSPILTEKIPITIHPPSGQAPEGYQFLDIWPIHLTQSVSGPQDLVLDLKNRGLELSFNLDEITADQLNAIHTSDIYDDEVSFNVPDQWKKVIIPFYTRGLETLNDPQAKNLQINFLRTQLLPLKNELPIHVFYPLKFSAVINPKTYPLAPSGFVHTQNVIDLLTVPLFAKNVSKLFLEIIRDNLEIDIIAALPTEKEKLEWGVTFVDETHLEDTYVAFLLSHFKTADVKQMITREKEEYFRHRFRHYLQRFTLYLSPQYKLELEARLENGKIRLHVPNAFLLSTHENKHAS